MQHQSFPTCHRVNAGISFLNIIRLIILLQMDVLYAFSIISTRHWMCRQYPRFVMSSTSIRGVDDDLIQSLQTHTSGVPKLQFEKLFDSFAKNSYFVSHVWQQKPYYVNQPLDCVVGAYTMDDVRQAVDSDFLEAGRGTFQSDRGGWNMAAVSTPRGNSFQDAKLRFEDVTVAMKETSGTVVFNSAGGFIPKLAQVCLAAVTAFDLPCALNMYLTNPGQKTSAPPHTDKQDVFVIQTQGRKHWRVFSPPPPSRMPKADPLARGKSKDKLELTELTSPLLDVVLSPGQVLYVPAGFPHTTDTLDVESSDPSVHLTVGIDTHIWGLNYASMREFALRRSGIEDKVLITKLSDELYWKLQSAIPIGFLSLSNEQKSQPDSSSMAAASGPIEKQHSDIVEPFVRLLQEAEPSRWTVSEGEGGSIASATAANEVTARLRRHHREVTDLFRTMYNDVGFQITPTKMNLSFFRSQPYFQQLEKIMEDLISWSKPAAQAASSKSSKDSKKKGFGK